MNKLTFILILFLFSSCTSFTNNSKRTYVYEKAISNFERASIVKDLENKAIISAVYLNNVLDDYKQGENFFVGVYIDDDFKSRDKYGLKNHFYKLRLNKEKAIEIKELDFDSSLSKQMPFKNSWEKYYLVRFKSVKDSKLLLSFSNEEFGTALMNFEKN